MTTFDDMRLQAFYKIWTDVEKLELDKQSRQSLHYVCMKCDIKQKVLEILETTLQTTGRSNLMSCFDLLAAEEKKKLSLTSDFDHYWKSKAVCDAMERMLATLLNVSVERLEEIRKMLE